MINWDYLFTDDNVPQQVVIQNEIILNVLNIFFVKQRLLFATMTMHGRTNK